jgi:hypothetical protein
MRRGIKVGTVVGVVILIAAFAICLRPTAPSNYIYQDGRVLVGADGEPIELINNSTATNPTYATLVDFINEDPTDEGAYMDFGSDSEFAFLGRTCGDFAEAVHNNAEAAGIRAALVTIDFVGQDVGHALNAFETTDKGLIYVDCTGQDLGSWIEDHFVQLDKITGKVYLIEESLRSWDKVAYVEIGKEYGLIALDQAESLSYSFYEEYEQKQQEYEELVSDYNDEVTLYNQAVTSYEDASYGIPPPQAPDISEYGTSLEESRRLYAALLEWETEMEAWKAGREDWEAEMEAQWIELADWGASLQEKKQLIDELREGLGGLRFQPLGIVEDINIYWGNSQ